MANKINEIILKSGKKKQFIAQKLNISPSTLTRYCSGKTSPNMETLKKLSGIIGVSIDEFFLSINNTNT
jgi:transcriptional regulator with XRE-family HTH domain